MSRRICSSVRLRLLSLIFAFVALIYCVLFYYSTTGVNYFVPASINADSAPLKNVSIKNSVLPNVHVHSESNGNCPSPQFIGKLEPNKTERISMSDVEKRFVDVQLGGFWQPSNCATSHRVAVVIPFRDRHQHLTVQLNHLIPILQRQMVSFQLIVAEQTGDGPFNKGRVHNAAFEWARRFGVSCVIFHDVDLLAQDDRVPLDCAHVPAHLGGRVDRLNYVIDFDYLVGGVLAVGIEQYVRINGFANSYWSWGGEDEDLGKRLLAHNLSIYRPPAEIGRYTALEHPRRSDWTPVVTERDNMAEVLMHVDGLNCPLWKIVKSLVKPLYNHIFIDVGVKPADLRNITICPQKRFSQKSTLPRYASCNLKTDCKKFANA